MGMLSLGLGNYSAAVEHLTKAKDIAAKLQKTVVFAKMCTNLGIVKIRLCAYAEALELHTAAYDIARELQDLASQAVCAGNLGLAFISRRCLRVFVCRRALRLQVFATVSTWCVIDVQNVPDRNLLP